MKKLPWILATLTLLAACKQNPFPTEGRIVQNEPQKPPPVFPALVMDAPESVDVLEGQLTEFPLTATVPAPGRPLITVQGLPEGAVFDQAAMKVIWTPTFQQANDPRDPDIIVRTYPIKWMLSSSEDPVTITQEQTLLVVRDVSRALVLNLPTDPLELSEGKEFTQTIDVQSEDYPDGPFEIQVKNLPVGAVISRDLAKPSRFKITYTPSFRVVNVNETFTSFRIFVDKELEVSIFGPRGINISAPVTWRINDVREKAIVLAPTKVTQGTSVAFSLAVEDPNGEEPPLISLSPRPSFGLSELRTESTNPGNPARGVNPSIVASFRWTQIPPEKIGTTEDVKFKACVKRSRFSKDFCTEHVVKVTFEVEEHKPPIVDRTAFPLGKVLYVREQEKLPPIPLRVKDGEFNSTQPSVKITPDTISNEVKWALNNLNVEGKKAGLKQFNLTATSVFGVVTVESFLLEVLPWSWSSVLLFGESPADAEVKNTTPFFESVQAANPVLQLNDPRLMVLRKTVMIGTTALSEPSIVGPMADLAATAKDVVISTPLIDKLDGALKTELAALGVQAQTRIADLTDYTLGLSADSRLSSPTNAIKLAGKLTAESARPAPLKLTGTQCEALLELKKTGEDPLVVGASCVRNAKGDRLVVFGFELADIQTTPTDNRLIKKWLQDLVAQ